MQIDAAANRVHRIEIVMPARAGDTRDQHIHRLRIGRTPDCKELLRGRVNRASLCFTQGNRLDTERREIRLPLRKNRRGWPDRVPAMRVWGCRVLLDNRP